MGWKIDADIDSLKKGAADLGKLIDALDAHNNDLANVLHSMSDVWEGDAALAFINILRNDHENAVDSKEILIEFQKAIEAHCKELEEKDGFFEKAIYGVASFFNLN